MPEETKPVAVAERPDETTENDLSAFASVEIEPSALPLLTGTRKMLAAKIVEILQNAAQQHNIKTCMYIRKLNPHWDSTKLLEIRQVVSSSKQEYLAYWDKLDDYIQPWADSLPEEEDRILEYEILFLIDWDMNEPA